LNDVSSWRNPVIYPPLPALRRVTVNVEDLARLDEGEFLNDTILSFALREIEESMDTRRRQEIHMFNTFFYTALSTKLGRKAFNFEAVKKWTNKVNIFEFPYVVVPINVSQHWFVAIIYNLPSMVAQRQDDNAREAEYSGQAEDTEQAPFDTTKVEEIESSDSGADIASSQTPNTRMSQLSIHDDDHRILGKRATQQAEKPRRYGAKKRAAPVRKCNALGPVIITLDSLGLTRSAEIRYLKDYIVAEANDKLGIALSPKDISGWTAKSIPQQTNFCDCGVLVVEYIRALAQDPHGFVKEMLRLAPVDHQRFDGFTASAMREKLRDGLLELSKATEEELKAKKAQKVKERQALRQTANHNPPATLPTEPGEENQGIPERPTTSEGPVSADLRLTSSPTIHASQQQRDAAASSPHSPRGSDIPLSVPSSQNRTASRTVDSFGVQTVRLPKHGSAFR
jgi:sentrin-specific protease 7